jgi:hypothetical protein
MRPGFDDAAAELPAAQIEGEIGAVRVLDPLGVPAACAGVEAERAGQVAGVQLEVDHRIGEVCAHALPS